MPVAMMCRALGVKRSGFYARCRRPPSARARDEVKLVVEIKAAHEESRRRYGSPRVHRELKARGRRVGKNRVARLMREHNVAARKRRRFRKTTDSRHDHPIAPNVLNREFTSEGPNMKWAGDITYIWTKEGWLYLAALLDLYSRYAVGWAIADNLESALAHRALDMGRPSPAASRARDANSFGHISGVRMESWRISDKQPPFPHGFAFVF
jgi:transposase InsO family protein